MQPLLELKNITRSFGETSVLENVNLTVNRGEIHAVLGENGAGKSTLMNLLFGMQYQINAGQYSGEIWFEGKKAEIKTPMDTARLGIGMVHQEMTLIEEMTVTENIFLNREVTKPTILSKILGKKWEILDKKEMRQKAESALIEIGITIDTDLEISALSMGYRQLVEIARESSKENTKLLVLDEPTAILSAWEIRKLMEVMKKLCKKGCSILFITHKLDEVMEIAHKISILRHGKITDCFYKNEIDYHSLVYSITGEEQIQGQKKAVAFGGKEVLLSLKNFSSESNGESISHLNLEVLKGEILGVTGPAGQGKLAIGNGIMGIGHSVGKVMIEQQPLLLNHTIESYKRGIAFVPEDRKKNGIEPDSTIEENICITALQSNKAFIKRCLFFHFPDKKKIKQWSEKMIEELGIKCEGITQKAGELSGGNQQKLCLAKALAVSPKLLIVSEVTRGVDIKAKKLLLEKILELNQKGMTVLMIDSDYTTVQMFCNRIAVVSGGRLNTILSSETTVEEYEQLFREEETFFEKQ